MILMEILKVIVIGIVEGLTEWLPISSTGHIILLEEMIQLNVTEAFKDMFEVVIQLGAILAVMFLYFDKLNPFSRRKKEKHRRFTLILWLKIIVACIPAAVLGLVLDDWIKNNLKNGFIISLMLIVYGAIFIIVEKRNRPVTIDRLSLIDYQTALYIGLFQVLSLIPGTSRSGVTIIGAMIIGCSRPVASEFSFFLAIPIMFGASFVKIVKYILHLGDSATKAVATTATAATTPVFAEVLYLIIGMIVAFFVSMYAIRFLLSWVKKHDFVFFGIYRIVLGVIVMIWYILSSIVK